VVVTAAAAHHCQAHTHRRPRGASVAVLMTECALLLLAMRCGAMRRLDALRTFFNSLAFFDRVL